MEGELSNVWKTALVKIGEGENEEEDSNKYIDPARKTGRRVSVMKIVKKNEFLGKKKGKIIQFMLVIV